MNSQDNDKDIRRYCVDAWKILVSRAPKGESITYKDLAIEIGLMTDQDKYTPQVNNEIQGILGRIHFLCNRDSVAPLSVLVVEARHWAPGRQYRRTRSNEPDFPGCDDVVCVDRQRVKDQDWSSVSAPSLEDFSLA